MIDSQMTETIRDEAIITSEIIRVNETSALHLFDNPRDKSLTGDILNNIHPDFSSATLVSLSSPAKVRLIHRNLPEKSE
ncbi:MAG: hypothetical protein WCF90_09890 [Methanomicrobiales archaeon]